MTRFLAAAALVLLFPFVISAQQTLEEVTAQAQSRNLDIIKAERAVRDAERDLKGEISLRDSLFSIEGGYRYLSPTAAARYPTLQSGFSGSLGVDLPFVPQASLGGSLEIEEDLDFLQSVSLSLKPFMEKDHLYPEEEQYGKALVVLKYLRHQISKFVEQTVLGIIVGEMELELAERTLDLERTRYSLVQGQLEVGDASFQDLQTQVVNLNEAQENLYNTELQQLEERKSLSLLLGSPTLNNSVLPITMTELQEMIAQRVRAISSLESKISSSEKLETFVLEHKALKEERMVTRLWRPDARASATASFPEFIFSLSMSLSFSPAELKNEELDDLEADILEKELDIEAELFSIGLQKRLVEQSIAISRQALTSTLLQGEKDLLSLEETELLVEKGMRTSLELEQSKLNVRRSEVQSFKAAADLYKAQFEFLTLYLN